MTTENRKDLARLLHGQTMAIAQDIATRAIGDRLLTDTALADIKSQLVHMIHSIEEREQETKR